MMNRKLIELLMSGKPLRGGAMLDSYNQQISYDCAFTLRSCSDRNHFIVEDIYDGQEIDETPPNEGKRD
jgi:hypothetical protein